MIKEAKGVKILCPTIFCYFSNVDQGVPGQKCQGQSRQIWGGLDLPQSCDRPAAGPGDQNHHAGLHRGENFTPLSNHSAWVQRVKLTLTTPYTQ